MKMDWIKSFISLDKYFKWKKIVEYMQILKDNEAAVDDCGFDSLFSEWDAIIMADKYAWLNLGNKYLMVPYKKKGNDFEVTISFEVYEDNGDFFSFGGVGSTEWSYEEELDQEITVKKDQLYFGVFSPINTLCTKKISLTTIKEQENTRIRQGFLFQDISTELLSFFTSQLSFVEYFFDKVLFYIKINKITTLNNINSKPNLKF